MVVLRKNLTKEKGERRLFEDVRERLCASALPDHSHRPPIDLPLVIVEPTPTHSLSSAPRVTLLRRLFLKSESGCSDPPRHQTQSCRKRDDECDTYNLAQAIGSL